MTDYIDLQKAAEYAAQDTIKFAGEGEEMRALQQFHEEVNPETVLALIAENQRLKTLRSVTERDLAQELEVWRNGPSCWSCGDTGDVHDIVGEWRGQCDCNAAKLIDVTGERDQLKAENEALRKDAERWRFFSILANDLQAFPHAWGKMTPEKMDAMCDQAMADAAMGKGEKS
ncbi:hypothetical protein GH769_14965 [Pseudomonas sp. CFSAN084952]|uniref:hypothetical protein n=1 Tax=Pseudomonas TaxID=286 RepID=UPI001299F094|nr:hypothetical protein [Pseudomonas sp. CFSAN084952]QGF94492.1 hypothetical protein GH769_14965 [Pseudomonas sp. CFSAN084952]